MYMFGILPKALYLALYSGKAHGIYNLSSYNAVSNKQLAELCVKLLESDSRIIFSGKEDFMDDYIWDVSLEHIKEDIGYEPEILIEEAILEYANMA